MKTEAIALPATRTRGADYAALAKPRLNFLVVVTTMVGYYLGAREAIDLAALAVTVIGTACVAGGASAANQIYERDVDGMMRRTRLRPLPDGRIRPSEAWWFAGALSVGGLLILSIGANLLTAGVALATLVSYAAIYTPLKQRTAFSTVVGAIPGALPPVIGWAAARGTLSFEAWLLFAIVFLWQIPHFLAIAWMYREDYEQAGFPMLPVIEPDGRSTARQVVLYASALLPVSLIPGLVGLTDQSYVLGAFFLGVAFLVLAIRFALHRDTANARALFLGSIVYLPLVWTLMLITKT